MCKLPHVSLINSLVGKRHTEVTSGNSHLPEGANFVVLTNQKITDTKHLDEGYKVEVVGQKIHLN